MKAILSGSAGVAVLADGGNLFSIDIDRLDEVVPRRLREVPYLLGDAEDLQIVENVDAETTKRLLDEAWRGVEALQLALILMDGDLSDETRLLAAIELEVALGTQRTQEQVEAVLWSRPLPPAASIDGALALSRRTSAIRTEALIDRVRGQQRTIGEVWTAFEGLPEALFGKAAGDKARARAALVREGAARELVAARERGAAVGAAAPAILMRPDVQTLPNHQTIVAAWVERLGKGDTERLNDAFHAATPVVAAHRLPLEPVPEKEKRDDAQPNLDRGKAAKFVATRGILGEQDSPVVIDATKSTPVQQSALPSMIKASALVKRAVRVKNPEVWVAGGALLLMAIIVGGLSRTATALDQAMVHDLSIDLAKVERYRAAVPSVRVYGGGDR